MRTTVTQMLRRATRMQSIPSALVEWTSIILILLVVTLCTFSGDLQLKTRANPSQVSRASVTVGLGCERFRRHSDRCRKQSTKTCTQFTARGFCKHFEVDPNVGGCLVWIEDEAPHDCIEWALTNATPPCSSGVSDPDFPMACVTF